MGFGYKRRTKKKDILENNQTIILGQNNIIKNNHISIK